MGRYFFLYHQFQEVPKIFFIKLSYKTFTFLPARLPMQDKTIFVISSREKFKKLASSSKHNAMTENSMELICWWSEVPWSNKSKKNAILLVYYSRILVCYHKSLVKIHIFIVFIKECTHTTGCKTSSKWAFVYRKLKPRVTRRPIG